MKRYLKKILSPEIYDVIKKLGLFVHKFFYYPLVWLQFLRYRIIVHKIRRKDTITVAFFVLNKAVWKYEYLYELMLRHPRFRPIIVICPIVNYGKDHMFHMMNTAYDYFVSKGYETISTYDKETDQFIDIKKTIRPDIIAYTNPYKGLIHDKYYISKFLDTLTIYVSYFFRSSTDQGYTKEPLINLVWTFFVESAFHKEYSRKYIPIRSMNAVVTGYLGSDVFLMHKKITGNDWKINDNKHKKIIWAPHHTFEDTCSVKFSCFPQYCEYMLVLAEKYKENVEFVFKPHPLLKPKLVKLWGEERTNQYYNKWKTGFNTNYVEGDYVDLFLSSDAMIHDCDSFITEYMYARKPVLRTENGYSLEKVFHSFTLKCLETYYHAYNEREIEEFVINVINEIDPKEEERNKYLNDYLLPQDETTASEQALKYLLTKLSK